jgi:CheY-like chemotaxis protein
LTDEKIYIRVPDINEKVRNIRLKAREWKLLFTVDGKKTVSQLASIIKEDVNWVSSVLGEFINKTLVEEKGGPALAPLVAQAPVINPAQVPTQAPTAKSAPAPATPLPKAAVAKGGTKKKVLIVDDSLVIRKMVEIALEKENYQLVMAASGESALKLVQTENPDLVLLDTVLVDMSGLEVLKTMRETFQYPIIALAPKDAPQDSEEAMGRGATDFINKPFQDAELVGKVKQYLE